jgi:hypothetical protein
VEGAKFGTFELAFGTAGREVRLTAGAAKKPGEGPANTGREAI